jgi:hypothetical protein
VVKIARSEVKPPITPSNEVGVSPVPKEEDGWGETAKKKLMPNVRILQVCSLKTTTAKNASDAKNIQSGHTLCELSQTGLCM